MAPTAAAALAIRTLGAREGPALFTALARLLADAYPIMQLTTADAIAARAGEIERSAYDPGTAYAIAERDGELVGAMRLYDYTMNVHGRDALAGGVGSVAVALTQKRQGVARALIAWYLERYRERGAPFAVLHPFKFDFYRALGFGYGTPTQRYSFAPATLRDDGAAGTVRLLGPSDAAALCACDERVRAFTHGMIVRHRAPTERALANAALRYVGVEDGGALRGFMQTAVDLEPVLRNRDAIAVRDLVCEADRYRAALLGYLRSQRDQFARVAIESQEPAFHLVSTDPRDGSDEAVAPPAAHRVATTGLGLMYRILDVEAAFAYLPARPAPFVLAVAVRDAFTPPSDGTWTFRFGPDGPPQRLGAAEAHDATLAIGIADLASVVMGSVRLRDVVRYGLATVDPPAHLRTVDALFHADAPPQCTTRF